MKLKDRVCLVTGASRGIGYFTALELAKQGAHVVCLARTIGGLEELDDAIIQAGGSATLIPLDLYDMDGIDRLGAAIHERWGKLDVLVANAAILGEISPIGHIQAKVFEQVMKLNVTATWRLIRSLEPLLQKSDAGRALILSSGSPHSCKSYWSAYAASKAAVEALARVWANEASHTDLCINCVNPGPTRTAMRAQAMPGENPEQNTHPSEIGKAIAALCLTEVQETGMWYSVPDKKFMRYQSPA